MGEHGKFTPRPYPSPVERLLPRHTFDDWTERLLRLGSITRLAADVLLNEKGIAVEVSQREGATREIISPKDYPWVRPGRGTLFVGCHRNGNEAAFVAALMGRVQDKEFRVFAKPYGLIAKGLATWAKHTHENEAGRSMQDVLLPVVPQRIARERHPWEQRERFCWRLGMGRRLPSLNEIIDNNARSTLEMARCLERGGAGLIFPTGHIGDAAKGKWRTGAVNTMLALNPGKRAATDVVFFRFATYDRRTMAKAVLVGRPVTNATVQLDIAPGGSVAEILGGKDIKDPGLPRILTTSLQKTYREYFGPEEERVQ